MFFLDRKVRSHELSRYHPFFVISFRAKKLFPRNIIVSCITNEHSRT